MKFKIVKTHSRWKLKQDGFPIALRFESWGDCKDSGIERLCRDRLGQEAFWKNGEWKGHWGSPRAGEPRPYFVGFRNEAVISMILLSLSVDPK